MISASTLRVLPAGFGTTAQDGGCLFVVPVMDDLDECVHIRTGRQRGEEAASHRCEPTPATRRSHTGRGHVPCRGVGDQRGYLQVTHAICRSTAPRILTDRQPRLWRAASAAAGVGVTSEVGHPRSTARVHTSPRADVPSLDLAPQGSRFRPWPAPSRLEPLHHLAGHHPGRGGRHPAGPLPFLRLGRPTRRHPSRPPAMTHVMLMIATVSAADTSGPSGVLCR